MSIQVNFQGSGGGFVPPINFTSLLYSVTFISNTQVLQLASNPVTLIPAVGNFLIFPIQIIANIDKITVPYQTNGNLSIYFPTANKGLYYKLGSDFLFSTSHSNTNMPFDPTTINQLQYKAAEPLMLTTEFGNPTNGDGELIIAILYALV